MEEAGVLDKERTLHLKCLRALGALVPQGALYHVGRSSLGNLRGLSASTDSIAQAKAVAGASFQSHSSLLWVRVSYTGLRCLPCRSRTATASCRTVLYPSSPLGATSQQRGWVACEAAVTWNVGKGETDKNRSGFHHHLSILVLRICWFRVLVRVLSVV